MEVCSIDCLVSLAHVISPSLHCPLPPAAITPCGTSWVPHLPTASGLKRLFLLTTAPLISNPSMREAG